ncbi:MAG: winged helix-turn-helix domain-containing protein [bacterium]
MTKPYRSRGRVVAEILATIQGEGPVGVTRLTTVVNLTHARVQEHLADFEAHGLIESQADGERITWTMTARGNQALEELRRIDRAMQDFGINL